MVACSGSCVAQIACAIAVAAVPYVLKSMVEGAERPLSHQSRQQVYRPDFQPSQSLPQRFCRTLPNGRQCCCLGRPPRVEFRKFHTPYGTRVQWRAWCA